MRELGIDFVITRTPKGEPFMVSLQDDEGRILKIIWEKK